MCDNVHLLNVTEAQVSEQSKNLVQQAESSVALLQNVFSCAEQLQKHNRKLEEQLAEETQKRASAEETVQKQQSSLTVLKDEMSTLSASVSGLKQTIAEKEEAIEKANEEKERSITAMHRDLANQENLMKGLKFMRQNVDSFRLGQSTLQEPCGACMLPDGCVLVADTVEGLLLFSGQTELLSRTTSADWKWPQGLVYDVDNGHLMVSLMRKHENGWRRGIGFFNLKLEEERFIEGPPEAACDETIAKERLALGPHGELYLSLTDRVGSELYKWTGGKWHQLTKRHGATFIDVQVLSSHGALSELLLVESRMGYVHKFSVHDVDIADRRSLAIVEKPGAICVDDKRRLFVHDIISGKVREIDTFNFEPKKDICIVDDAVFSITASHGYLGVAVREAKTVRVFRYA